MLRRRVSRRNHPLIIASPAAAVLLFLELFSVTSDYRFWIYGAAFLLLGALGGIATGLQLRAPDALELMRRDLRPPIVFLRSFQEDHRVIHESPTDDREGGEYVTNTQRKASHEDTLAHLLRSVGPFVAVGQPGEPLATLGAARVYLADHEWKGTVESMVHRAGAVVLQPEFSSGTLWEVELVIRAVDLRRLLLVVPNPAVRPLRFTRVRQLIAERFGVTLPPIDTCPPCDAFYFDATKRPIPLRLDGNASQAAKPFVDHLLALGESGRGRT